MACVVRTMCVERAESRERWAWEGTRRVERKIEIVRESVQECVRMRM